VEVFDPASTRVNAMIYTPSFINIGSDIQKLTEGIHRNADSMKIA
jgi:hypothetical protein